MRQEIRYGKKIVELRRTRGWTQEHLAEATRLEVRTIQRAEKDETKGPETLQAIVGAFDVELADMQTVRLHTRAPVSARGVGDELSPIFVGGNSAPV